MLGITVEVYLQAYVYPQEDDARKIFWIWGVSYFVYWATVYHLFVPLGSSHLYIYIVVERLDLGQESVWE